MLRAQLNDGSKVALDPAQGDNITELVSGLTAGSLTGSAVPLAQAKIRAIDGRVFTYGDVTMFEDDRAE